MSEHVITIDSVVAGTLAAFMNAEGGTLLVGVDVSKFMFVAG